MTINESIKTIAKQYMNTIDFSDVEFGFVISANPLIVRVKNFTLSQEFFVVPKSMTDYEVCHRRVRYEDDNSAIKATDEGLQWSIVYNAIKEGETLIMIKLHGGQRYFIVDRTA